MQKVSDVELGKIKRWVVSLNVGGPGAGKTHNASTYPKSFFIITEPNSSETFMIRPELRKNVVAYEYFIPDPSDNDRSLKSMYGDLKTSNIVKEINLAKEMALKSEVETLVIDNITYLVLNKWMHISKYEIQYSKSGEVNKMAMYSSLRDWCYDFLVSYVLTFKGNIVINCHEVLESDEAMDKKVDKTFDIVPSILGSFRNDILGLVSNVFFLTKEVVKENGKDAYKYYARTNKGNQRNAKNRFNLPSVIENPSYEIIRKAIEESVTKKETK